MLWKKLKGKIGGYYTPLANDPAAVELRRSLSSQAPFKLPLNSSTFCPPCLQLKERKVSHCKLHVSRLFDLTLNVVTDVVFPNWIWTSHLPVIVNIVSRVGSLLLYAAITIHIGLSALRSVAFSLQLRVGSHVSGCIIVPQ